MDAAEIARLKEIAGKAFLVSFHDEGGAYIGDVSAGTVLALLAALEQSQAALAEAEEAGKHFEKEAWGAMEERDALRARNAELEAALKYARDTVRLHANAITTEVDLTYADAITKPAESGATERSKLPPGRHYDEAESEPTKSDEEAAREYAERWAETKSSEDPMARQVLAMLSQARAEGLAAERERIAKWFEAKWVEDSGPDWGLASHEERSNWREQNRRVLAYAAAIRAGAKGVWDALPK